MQFSYSFLQFLMSGRRVSSKGCSGQLQFGAVEIIFTRKVLPVRLEVPVLGGAGISSPHQCSGEQAGKFLKLGSVAFLCMQKCCYPKLNAIPKWWWKPPIPQDIFVLLWTSASGNRGDFMSRDCSKYSLANCLPCPGSIQTFLGFSPIRFTPNLSSSLEWTLYLEPNWRCMIQFFDNTRIWNLDSARINAYIDPGLF